MAAMINVLLPVSCAGCGRPDYSWCDGCRNAPTRIHQPSLAWRQALWRVPVWALCDYEGVWRGVIVGWKDGGYHRMGHLLGSRLVPVLQRVVQGQPDAVVLVWIPGSWGGWIRRGVVPTKTLAEALARTWSETGGPRVVAWGGLRRQGGFSGVLAGMTPWKHKRLGRAQRLAHQPSFRASLALRGHRIVLVDDVLTTGVTAEQAARAIGAIGGHVIGVVVVAAAST